MLSAFSQKTISMEEATKDFRPWDNVIYDWDVEYKGYARGKDGEAEGYITVKCSECEKILFEGTEKQAKRLIIYCVECSQIP